MSHPDHLPATWCPTLSIHLLYPSQQPHALTPLFYCFSKYLCITVETPQSLQRSSAIGSILLRNCGPVEKVQAWQAVAWAWWAGWSWENPLLSFIFHHLCLSFSICKPGIIKTAHWAFHRPVGRISQRLQSFLRSLKERCYKKFKAGGFYARHCLRLHVNLHFLKLNMLFFGLMRRSTINQ